MGSEGSDYVRQSLVTNLMSKPIELPDPEGKIIRFLPQELGLGYPFMLDDHKAVLVRIPNPDHDPEAIAAAIAKFQLTGNPSAPTPMLPGMTLPDGTKLEPPTLEVLRHDFIVQVVWTEIPMTERLKKRAEKEAAEKSAAPQDPDAVATAG